MNKAFDQENRNLPGNSNNDDENKKDDNEHTKKNSTKY